MSTIWSAINQGKPLNSSQFRDALGLAPRTLEHTRLAREQLAREGYALPPVDPSKRWPQGQEGIPIRQARTDRRKGASAISKVASFAKAAAHYLINPAERANDEQIAARLAICQRCDQYNAEKSTCEICGCGCSGRATLKNKLAHKSQSCPHPDGPRWTMLE